MTDWSWRSEDGEEFGINQTTERSVRERRAEGLSWRRKEAKGSNWKKNNRQTDGEVNGRTQEEGVRHTWTDEEDYGVISSGGEGW